MSDAALITMITTWTVVVGFLTYLMTKLVRNDRKKRTEQ